MLYVYSPYPLSLFQILSSALRRSRASAQSRPVGRETATYSSASEFQRHFPATSPNKVVLTIIFCSGQLKLEETLLMCTTTSSATSKATTHITRVQMVLPFISTFSDGGFNNASWLAWKEMLGKRYVFCSRF
jgi:hypothetical protein